MWNARLIDREAAPLLLPKIYSRLCAMNLLRATVVQPTSRKPLCVDSGKFSSALICSTILLMHTAQFIQTRYVQNFKSADYTDDTALHIIVIGWTGFNNYIAVQPILSLSHCSKYEKLIIYFRHPTCPSNQIFQEKEKTTSIENSKSLGNEILVIVNVLYCSFPE